MPNIWLDPRGGSSRRFAALQCAHDGERRAVGRTAGIGANRHDFSGPSRCDRAVSNLELKLTPGTLVLFNGDRVYHAVTPIRADEYRYMVSMQYVTSGEMNPFMRFVSNMKDSIAYFGLRKVFFERKRKKNANPS
jgi:hypothetical protein